MKVLGANAFISPANLAVPVGQPKGLPSQPVTQASFGDVLSGMMQNVDEGLRAAERLSIGALTGDVPIQKVVETVVAAEQKVQLATSVRDKIVSAYLELTRMPI